MHNCEIIYSIARDLIAALESLHRTVKPYFQQKKNCRITSLASFQEMQIIQPSQIQAPNAQPQGQLQTCVVCVIQWDLTEEETKKLEEQDLQNVVNTLKKIGGDLLPQA